MIATNNGYEKEIEALLDGDADVNYPHEVKYRSKYRAREGTLEPPPPRVGQNIVLGTHKDL